MKELRREPTAKVSLRKNVLKVYNIDGEDVVYLPKDAQFEIELFNPTQGRVLAKIELNNKNISSSGIVLKPGERVFLERYLDEDRKFLFETYEVEDSLEVKEAIANNGLILVTFYAETVVNPLWVNTIYYDMSPRYYVSQTPVYRSNTVGLTAGFSCSTSIPCDERVSLKSVETGLIGKGEKSEQEFKNVSYNFNSYWINRVRVKILPDSQRLISSEDLKYRKYCSECGSKIKDTDKFCSNCGTKL